jgi:hypothetical protein
VFLLRPWHGRELEELSADAKPEIRPNHRETPRNTRTLSFQPIQLDLDTIVGLEEDLTPVSLGEVLKLYVPTAAIIQGVSARCGTAARTSSDHDVVSNVIEREALRALPAVGARCTAMYKAIDLFLRRVTLFERRAWPDRLSRFLFDRVGGNGNYNSTGKE